MFWKKINWSLIFDIIILLLFWQLNAQTPLLADDYEYAFIYTSPQEQAVSTSDLQPITNLNDILVSQTSHYLKWGGRSVVHFIVQLFMMPSSPGKALFNFCNAVVFVILINLAIFHATGKNPLTFHGKNHHLLLKLFFIFGLWFLLPRFGENVLWLTGSINYLWGITLILTFMIPYRYFFTTNKMMNWQQKLPHWLTRSIFFIFGLLAGWTNESASFALIIFLAVIIFLDFKDKSICFRHRPYNFPGAISGLIGALSGFCFMILAPGNFARATYFPSPDFILWRWFKNLLKSYLSFSTYFTVLIALLVVGITVIYILQVKPKKKSCLSLFKDSGLYFLLCLASIFAMTISPIFPLRAWFGSIVFLLISLLNLGVHLFKILPRFKITWLSLSVLGLIYFASSYVQTFLDINKTNQLWQNRFNVISNFSSSPTSFPIVLEPIPASSNRRNPTFELIDMSTDPQSQFNRHFSKYYKIKAVQSN